MFKKIKSLKAEQIPIVSELWQQCLDADGFESKNFPLILQSPYRNYQNDLVVWEKDQLVAYLGFFLFSATEAEIAVFVHPDFRHKSMFTKLWAEAQQRIKSYGYGIASFGCNQKSDVGLALLEKLGAKYHHTEYNMHRPGREKEEVLKKHRIGLREVGLEHLQFISNIHAMCFPTPKEVAEQRFSATMPEPGRKVYLIVYQNRNIGKIHYRLDADGTAFIHDVCVIPKMQGKGIGKQAMQRVVNQLLDMGCDPISLDVEAVNERALRLYKGIGFELLQGYDYHKLSL